MLNREKRIKTKEQLKDWLDYELRQYPGKNSVLDVLKISEFSVLRCHQKLLRKTEYYQNTGKKLRALFYRIRLRKLQNKYALHIPVNCCQKGLRIMHLGPVLINNRSIIGEDCQIHFNVILANKYTDGQAPVLDDGIIVGAGAIIIGPVRIAKNVVIGANAVVTHDIVEEDIAVAGMPAYKISNNGRTSCSRRKKEVC